MTQAFIYDHVRTPRGKGRKDGALYEVTALELATQTLEAIANRSHVDTALIGDVILGCVDPVGEAGADIARSAALNAGFATSVPGIQINRFCASGLEAVNFAASTVSAGVDDLIVAGGVESMSRIGMGASGGAIAVDPAVAIKTYFMPQGVSADLIATKYGFTREQADQLAVESHRRAAQAWTHGWFNKSVIPVCDINGLPILERDEAIRPATDMAALAKLNPSFALMAQMGGFAAVASQAHPDIETLTHIHHAGNSSGIVDGASAVLIGNKRGGKAASLRARARIVGSAHIGSDTAMMLTGPVDVTQKLLKKCRMEVEDIDLFEINEAFSSVVLRFMQAFSLDPARVNVAGGAIAMGHPLGATGAMILGTVLDELERRDLNTALITLCVAAGMGTATIIERV